MTRATLSVMRNHNFHASDSIYRMKRHMSKRGAEQTSFILQERDGTESFREEDLTEPWYCALYRH
jgi:hypothetical protein